LHLNDNKIKELPTGIFVKLTAIEQIYTYNNPATTNGVDFSEIEKVELYNETWNEYYQQGEKFNQLRQRIE
jgi:Leucine-rich repeat (LRR) protein